MKMRVWLFLVGIGLLVSGCSTMDAVTGKQTRNFYSLDKDVEIGSQVYSETVAEMKQRG
ncbi:MAG: hypothetical protein IT583_01410, partial [Verrucomicrobia bacterium]|nr:hypothetical protein [Verrucomicrobiota bacterium]